MRPSLQRARRTSTTYSRSASEARISGVWSPNPSKVMACPVSHVSRTVDGSFGVAEARCGDAGAAGDDLGADGHCRLLRRAGAEVEADRSEDAAELGVGDALVTQPLVPLVGRAPAAHGTEVADLRAQRGLDGRHVELVVVGQHADGVARSEAVADALEQSVGPVDDDLVGEGEALQIGRAHV